MPALGMSSQIRKYKVSWKLTQYSKTLVTEPLVRRLITEGRNKSIHSYILIVYFPENSPENIDIDSHRLCFGGGCLKSIV